MTTVVTDRASLAAVRQELPEPVAVVMTMGALHDGHVQLIRAAREVSASVLVTVFVNPLQFGAGEDLERYPRTLDADLAQCEREGVDVVFAPDVAGIYPGGEPVVRVSAGALGEQYEGAHRPGHFDGVLTVVAKLLHLTRPAIAVYGEKDAQQLALIRRMVSDLDIGVQILGVPTVREPDGLALSSRNRFLSAAERSTALALSQALGAAARAADRGAAGALAAAQDVLAASAGLDLDYAVLVDEATWQRAGDDTVTARLLVAGRIGRTRLIDNVQLAFEPKAASAPKRATAPTQASAPTDNHPAQITAG